MCMCIWCILNENLAVHEYNLEKNKKDRFDVFLLFSSSYKKFVSF